MISAVLFDLDGTLVETEELKAISHELSVREFRPDVPEGAVVSAYSDDLVGHSREEVARTLISRFDLEGELRERMDEFGESEPWEALVAIRREIYEEILRDSDLLLEKRYPHNIELLESMRESGYPTGLATMSHRHQVDRVLSVLGLESSFDVVATMEDVRRGKPDPEIYFFVAEKLGISPEECVAVEDSTAGVRSALAAGTAVVAVPTEITGKGLFASGILDERWMVEDPRRLNEVVEARISAAGGRKSAR